MDNYDKNNNSNITLKIIIEGLKILRFSGVVNRFVLIKNQRLKINDTHYTYTHTSMPYSHNFQFSIDYKNADVNKLFFLILSLHYNCSVLGTIV